MATAEPATVRDAPAETPAPTPVAAPGTASIKPQFIDLDHKRRLATEYLPAAVTKELEGDAYKNEEGKSADSTTDVSPGPKKKKFKGRIKKRPREQRPDGKDRLCPQVVAEEECRFGEKCRYSHDVAGYISAKPADLGETCHLFATYGKCRYGLMCRFAKQHLAENKNVVNEELFEQKKDAQLVDLVKNSLSKDLQHKLWKKKYDFSRANKILKDVQARHNAAQAKKGGNAKPAEVTESASPQPDSAGTQDGSLPDSVGNGNSSSQAVTPVETSSVKQGTDQVTETPGGDAEASRFSKSGALTDEDVIKLRPAERKKIDFSDKLYLAPLTTVGNLPFRRVCKQYGADITCGEMALAVNLLQGQQSEWALLKRHASEDIFGVQLCGSFPDTMTRCAQLLTENIDVDFVDINCGCPIDLIYKKGEGCALMGRTNRFEQIVHSMTSVMDVPLTVKIRTGIFEDKNLAHSLVPRLRDWGVSMVTVHGRSREQRYTRLANWEYINSCALAGAPMPIYGNGDILSYHDAKLHCEETSVSGLMVARGALIKPWLFTEIKEERDWDISSTERLDMLKGFVNSGMEHWGSDQQGVANTRKFLLEWLSFLYRYIPVGILEQPPQKINLKPPYYFGRDQLETLMASPNCADWVKISEMLLGPVPDNFTFLPKHRANAYS